MAQPFCNADINPETFVQAVRDIDTGSAVNGRVKSGDLVMVREEDLAYYRQNTDGHNFKVNKQK
jgi:hypothetical protein